MNLIDRAQNRNRFVISGGPGAGKTTTLVELAKLGFSFIPEAAREIIREQVQSGGTALPWADRKAYTDLMLQRSVESFRNYLPSEEPAFADRGVPDTLCYARLIGLPDTRDIEDACRRYRYARLVFLAPPWKEIYATDSERKQDFAEAERTFDLLVETYRDCGYRTMEVPKLAPAARAQFMADLVRPRR